MCPATQRSRFFYPSVSLGWVFTQLEELKSIKDVLSFGKLRASFAQVGQAGTYYNNYYYTPSYGSGMYAYTPVTYPLPTGQSTYVPMYVVYDPNLKPQNTSNFEIGTELGFFNGRLRFDYTFSYQNVKDQIFEVPIDGSTGYQYILTNAGKMETQAHELSINAAILSAKDYSLDLGVNFTRVWNYVKELAPGVESIMLGGYFERFPVPMISLHSGVRALRSATSWHRSMYRRFATSRLRPTTTCDAAPLLARSISLSPIPITPRAESTVGRCVCLTATAE